MASSVVLMHYGDRLRMDRVYLCSVHIFICARTRDHETGGAAIAHVARFESSPCRSGPWLRLARRQVSVSALRACSPARHEPRLHETRTNSLLHWLTFDSTRKEQPWWCVPLLAMLCWFALDSSREKDHVGVCHDKRKWMIVQLCKCVKAKLANDIG